MSNKKEDLQKSMMEKKTHCHENRYNVSQKKYDQWHADYEDNAQNLEMTWLNLAHDLIER